MKCKEIIQVLEALNPLETAEEWDNSGFQVGDREKEVYRVMVALDPSDAVIAEAVEKQADMLITHHPLLLKGIKRVEKEHFIGRRIISLVQHEIAYYVMHTNYDACSMAVLGAEYLGLTKVRPLVPGSVASLPATGEASGSGMKQYGCGSFGVFPEELSLTECALRVKERFGITNVRIYGDGAGRVRTAAILPGSGRDYVGAALSSGAQVYITGDISHHTGIDAAARGLSIIDGGHYSLEHIFVRDLKNILQNKLGISAVFEAAEQPPFLVI